MHRFLLLFTLPVLLFISFESQGQHQRASRGEGSRRYAGTLHEQAPKKAGVQLINSLSRESRGTAARPALQKSAGTPTTLNNRVPQGREVILGPQRINAFGTISLTSDYPPNTDLAVSANGLMVTVDNDYLSIWDTDGNEVLVETWVDFFKGIDAPLGKEILFPKVMLDPASGRFVVSVNHGNAGDNSSLFVLISETTNPTQGWLVYEFFSSDWKESGYLSNLSLGLSTEEVFISADVLNTNQQQVDVVIYQIDKLDLFAGTSASYLLYRDFVDFNSQLGSFLHATQYDFNETVGPGMYFVSRTDDQILLWDITGDIDNTKTALELSKYGVESYTFKTSVSQPDIEDKLYAGNGQITDAFYANDFLYMVHSAVDPANDRQGIILWKMDALSENLEGYFYSTGAYDMAFPSVCMVGENPKQPEFFVGYLYASESIYPGMGGFFVEANGTTGGLVETELGSQSINLNNAESLEYWGTYSGMVRQHLPDQPTRYWQLGVVGEKGGYTPVVARLNVDNMDLPEAAFSTQGVEGPGPLSVTFQGTTDTEPATFDWHWYFEGGSPSFSFDQNVTVTYADTGRYDVQLIVTNGVGFDTLLQEDLVHVTALVPGVAFSASTTEGLLPFEVQFTDLSTYVPTSWAWEFPGGTPSTSSAQHPKVTYAEEGTYSVKLTATNAAGSSTVSAANYITTSRPPLKADFTSTATTGSIPHTISFTDQSTGNPVQWAWSFPGGSPSTSSDQNPKVNYSQEGLYDVTLTVTNAQGEKNTLSLGNYVHALPPPPVANFSASDSAGTTPFVVTFQDLSSNHPTAWQWEFPGGNPSRSTLQNPTVTYQNAGTFTVKLTATNGGGSGNITAVNLISVTVIPPEAAFTVSDPDGTAPFNVTFSDQSLNKPTSWQWSFPGGIPSSSTEANPRVTYPTAGDYDVTLVVSNEAGNDQLTKSGAVSVSFATPKAQFTANPTQGIGAMTVTFTDESSLAPQAWDWTFEGGSPASSTDQNPVVLYTTPGKYAVTLTAKNPAGENTLTRNGYIHVLHPLPIADFAADQVNGEAEHTVVFTNQSLRASSFAWQFPGGSPSTSTEENPIVTYAEPGEYDVFLTAANLDGATDVTSKRGYITVTQVTNIPAVEATPLRVYPNPTQGAFVIEWVGEPQQRVTVKLYNQQGILIAEQPINAWGSTRLDVDLGPISQGLYHLELSSETARIGTQRLWIRP